MKIKIVEYFIRWFKKPETQKDFEIESLDPDQRSWYYDGCGIKRPKDE